MGGCRCSYKTCTNTTKTRDNLHFFHYPVKHKERCRLWIENANKPQFYDLDEDQLRNKVVCETHFEDRYFPNIQKKRLLQGAIPTLDGDCEKQDYVTKTSQDVQVLPANADGTIFILETNHLQNIQSERVESYIYTNNGLVLPIDKCHQINDDNFFELNSVEIEKPTERVKIEQLPPPPPALPPPPPPEDDINFNLDDAKFLIQALTGAQKPNPFNKSKQTEEAISKTMEYKYAKKIKQHSKDIAILKRMLKSQKTIQRRRSNFAIVNSLKKQIPSSLSAILRLNLNLKGEFSDEDLNFFKTIYETSPQVYQLLNEKYCWKLPNYETLQTLMNTNGNGNSN